MHAQQHVVNKIIQAEIKAFGYDKINPLAIKNDSDTLQEAIYGQITGNEGRKLDHQNGKCIIQDTHSFKQ